MYLQLIEQYVHKGMIKVLRYKKHEALKWRHFNASLFLIVFRWARRNNSWLLRLASILFSEIIYPQFRVNIDRIVKALVTFFILK